MLLEEPKGKIDNSDLNWQIVILTEILLMFVRNMFCYNKSTFPLNWNDIM